ncbi:hypothetical protein [Epilithonimonas lactis]|uniref:Uncharacterized protein n=1 Tax=Epilithonimonas lactis TaxID=421072 RepID=A0A085BF88_9FLAO|nr:hypothetical protein [Epilithonimonas lactis]KFC21133.1 hypothetical protein IO89_13045 [Epilithonimonas lactis]SEP74307.1 hypothetical protein SAMN04488097_0505 [Epilithonimonas lactis]
MKSILLSFSLLFFFQGFGQEKEQLSIKKGDFPEGVYQTLEDVLNKKPTSTDEVYFKPADSRDSSSSPEKVFFYFKEKDKRVRIPLAVSHNGEMYFQTYRKYTNKKDKGYDPDQYSRFCKVTNYGRFIYFEENMKGLWSKAFMGNLSPITYSIKGNTKGIVLDLDNKEFNMLRDCEDLNDFLKQHQIPEITCDSDKFTMGELQATIDEINKPYR